MITLDFASQTPLVAQIEQHLRAKIETGYLQLGTKVPSVRQLAKQCGVSTPTVVEAYNRLVARGFLEPRRASGYYVAHQPAPPPIGERRAPADLPVDSSWLVRRVYEEAPFDVQAGCGWLPADWLYEDGVKAGLRIAGRRHGGYLGRYGTPHGYLPLRRLLQHRLATQGIDAPAEQIVLTNGASHALSLVMRLLLRPGDVAFIDDPGHSNLISSLRHYGLKVVGVPRTPQGIDAAMLADLAQQHRPRVFFTNSNLQNPTGTSLKIGAGHRVLQLAELYNFHIVEDDVFSELQPAQAHSLAALDGLRRVIYVQSFSKTISPTLRVGFVACPAELAEDLSHLKMLEGLTTSELAERIVLAILTEGHHRRYLASLRERLARAQQFVCGRLENAGLRLFHRPQAGLFVWAELPADICAETLTQLAARDGIMLAPGALFRIGEGAPAFRFNVACSDSPKLYRFFESTLSRHGASGRELPLKLVTSA
jgi:DNA-binding transcriptional MocR family regulator